MKILEKFGLKWLLIGHEKNNLHVRFGYANDPKDQIIDLDIDMSEKQDNEFYNSLIDYYLNYKNN